MFDKLNKFCNAKCKFQLRYIIIYQRNIQDDSIDNQNWCPEEW